MLPTECVHHTVVCAGITGRVYERNKVLFLDDEQKVLNSISRIFVDEPYGVAVASTPFDAMKIISTEKIKVVLSDQRMPIFQGWSSSTMSRRNTRTLSASFLRPTPTFPPLSRPSISARSTVLSINHGRPRMISAVKGALSHHDLVVENRRLFERDKNQE